jgi:myosin heavy subunit
LAELSVPIISSALEKRFKHNAIYTYVGDILVAVNPFTPLPLYDQAHQDMYLPGDPTFAHMPHIFRMAQQAFTNLVNTRFNQCCVISGESGAGKVGGCVLNSNLFLWYADFYSC